MKPVSDVFFFILREWAAKSGHGSYWGLFDKLIGAVDGLLVETRSPTKRETTKVAAYYSGHKKRFGINVQAMCDARLRFLSVSAMCPGKTNDLSAFRHSDLAPRIGLLPDGYYAIGDNAYINSDKMLVPFPGADLGLEEDSYNFFHSQLRVTIERAFGLLVGRWGVLWRPLRVPLHRQARLILALCKLHNFCLDENPAVYAEVNPAETLSRNAQERRVFETQFAFQRGMDGWTTRRAITDRIANLNLQRPQYNLDRNAGNGDESDSD